MEITVIGSSNEFARGFITWAVPAQDVTIVGPNRMAAEMFVRGLGAGAAAGPADPLRTDIIVFALPYVCLRPVWESYGDQFDGKVVVDLLIPVDLETGELIHPEAGSAAEEITQALPRARVVKAFNPGFAGSLVAEQPMAPPRDVLLASDDRGAKRLVARLFEEGGMRAIDVGPLRRARELEAFGYLHFVLGQPSRRARSTQSVHRRRRRRWAASAIHRPPGERGNR